MNYEKFGEIIKGLEGIIGGKICENFKKMYLIVIFIFFFLLFFVLF